MNLNQPLNLPPVPERRKRPGGKGFGLGIAFLALIGLLFVMVRAGSRIAGTEPPATPPSRTAPNASALAKQWSEIQAHAVAPPRGDPNAPYTMVEFGDFQCPPCGYARPKLEKLLGRYPKQVNLLFVERPLPGAHRHAVEAAEASEIAAAQGKFWPMYDVLYQHQDSFDFGQPNFGESLKPGFFDDYAAQAGLDKAQFRAAYDGHQGQQKVADSMKFADSLGINATPTVLVRDNKTGKITAVSYHDIVGKKTGDTIPDGSFIQHPPWTAPVPAAAQAARRP